MPGADQRGLLADRARPEPGAGPVRRAPVVRNAHERDVEVRRRVRPRQQHERGDLAEARRDERVTRLHAGAYSFACSPATASTRRSTSSGEVNTEKLARLVPTTPRQRMSGIAQ